MDNINNENKENIENNNLKKLKIVKGDSKGLNISKVKDSLPFESDENLENPKENIVVPKNQKD